jgi:chorismate mutase/prephenate dehydratase|tara:strand:+ start:1313 stop:2146 length:834 start_codon:yes stop_codon:yes gene_type:complete
MNKRKSVAFQGERGAYSEEAILSFFKSDVIVSPHPTLFDTFEAVQKKNVDFAVVPVENSLEGSVNETYDLLLSTDLKVQGEIKLRIQHSLIARPELKISKIRTVYSHPQALAQCRKYLRNLGVTLVATYDTAGSVKIIREKKSNGIAAIASIRAASIYGMKVLKEGIEDNSSNYTRFFILAFEDVPQTGNDKTSIVFSAKHDPGALFAVLKEFADKEINLTKIESRPTRKKPWEYNFYLDFEGHREDEKCKAALMFLKKKHMLIKVLGSYPKMTKIK